MTRGNFLALSSKRRRGILGFMACLAFAVLSGGELPPSAQAEDTPSSLVINSMASDPTAKAAFEGLIKGFEKKHPGIKVRLNTIDHESYKVQIRTWLPSRAPDVAMWFAGNRARFFVEKGLVEPIDDLWATFGSEFGEAAKKASSFDGKAYLLPLNYYHWGFYYRKDLFEKAGIKEAPQTWDSLKEAVLKLTKAKLIPIALGTKQAWPAAAWFDFINMRLNGYDFHMDLLRGKESFTDARVKKTMALWKELADLEAFPKNAPALTWQEASALLWQSKAAMYLMGNFLAAEIPKAVDSEVGFFRFPVIDEKIPLAEVAPTDVIFIPAKAQNKKAAKLFLSYAASAEAQAAYNEANQLLPPNTKAKVDLSNRFRKSGQDLLAGAAGLSQFFDRDTDPQVAKAGMDGFVQFLAYPDKVESILDRIQKTQERVSRSSR